MTLKKGDHASPHAVEVCVMRSSFLLSARRFRTDDGHALCVVSEVTSFHGCSLSWQVDYPSDRPEDAHAFAFVSWDPFHGVADDDHVSLVAAGFLVGSDVAALPRVPDDC